MDYIQNYYNQFIVKCFAHPFITLGAGVGFIVLGIVLFTLLPQKMMPRAERNQFAVEIYLPTGTAVERTAQVADSLRDMIKKDKRVVNVTTFYGMSSPRFQASYAPQLGGSNFAQFIVNTENDHDTQDLLNKFTPMYSNYFEDAKVRMKELDYSDAISPVEIRFSGDDLTELHAVVDKVTQIMRKDSNLLLVRSNFEGSCPGLKIMMDNDEANRIGLNRSLLSMNLATRFGSGIPLTTVWEGDYPVSVMLKDNHAGLQQPDDLKNAMVSGMLPGTNVPLRQIADVKPDWNEGMIVRRNGITTVSVMADIRRGVNLNKETDRILERISATKLPAGVKMTAGGQRASDNEYNPQIYGGLCISVVIIFLILLLHFKNIRMSLLIMYSLLFSLVGLSIGMLVMKQDMGVTAILGVISLMGIIVRNGIIMIDYSEELRVKRHITAKHAALQAAQRRLRPIFLTSAAASMGVVPMVIQNSPLWGPMGTVVCFGTLISMLFIITMIPIGYWMIFRLQDKKRKLKNEKERSSKMLSEI